VDSEQSEVPSQEFYEELNRKQDEHTRALADAGRLVSEHIYTAISDDTQSLAWALRDIFGGNHIELFGLIEAPSQDSRLSHELTQNFQRSEIAEKYGAGLTRSLHNFVASAYTVAQCAATVWEHRLQRNGGVEDGADAEFRRLKMSGPVEVDLVLDFRRFSQHVGRLPLAQAHQTVMKFEKGRLVEETHTVSMNSGTLLKWDGWKAESKRYLEDHESVDLGEVVRLFAEHWMQVNRWVIETLVAESALHEEAFFELQVEYNAVLTGMDIDAAREATEARTKQWLAADEPSPYDIPESEGPTT
jgi:hypothetical protein